MSELTLISSHGWPLKPLVQAALENELRLVEAGIRRTQARLCEFENRFQMTTAEFICQFEDDRIEESLEFDEWVGEHRLLKRLNEKAEALRGVRFAN